MLCKMLVLFYLSFITGTNISNMKLTGRSQASIAGLSVVFAIDHKPLTTVAQEKKLFVSHSLQQWFPTIRFTGTPFQLWTKVQEKLFYYPQQWHHWHWHCWLHPHNFESFALKFLRTHIFKIILRFGFIFGVMIDIDLKFYSLPVTLGQGNRLRFFFV